eukprot:TRINITY_DN59896_c0_g1_i1.p1 TRINITY_DN59896_c0_g1~~TRINITY_DN59896_c0_g1_i1.p1  ORF type:complete len:435 (+),score=115.65 TRINITY_DN59896_c0_g1_i1:102-1307(+)
MSPAPRRSPCGAALPLRCLAVAAAAASAHAWGETPDEPGGPLDHRTLEAHPGTVMGRPDCVSCMDMPESWFRELQKRGLHPNRRFGPGTRSFLELQAQALVELYESSQGDRHWPMQFRQGWNSKETICKYGAWGMTGPALDVNCVESMYSPQPPRGCGGLIQGITITHGHVRGTMPESWKWLVGLGRLEIPASKMSGTLPDMGLWISMHNFDLRDNQFSGTLPDDFLPAPCLQTLNLRGNQFEGPIPKSIGDHSVLMSLNLANNKFEGTFPDLGKLPELAELDLSNNRLSGTLPSDFWMNSPRLRWVKLHQNAFTGPLPGSLAHPRSEISVISVRDNPALGKTVPPEFATLPLRVFNASDDMTCASPDMLRHVPETQVCGGRPPGGTKATFPPASPSGPGS